ncbi:POK25 protein, partial [Ciconia maguari]|nr:POK25 protein [Ciconia maguari]
RGLTPNQKWQTDFTLCEQLRPQPWLCVTVDTCSGMIIATSHRKTTAKAAQQHWVTAIAWLGCPESIKTDNGSCFTANSTKQWAHRWGIQLITGIPYNSTGQAIVE